jgi:hypothetical protein
LLPVLFDLGQRPVTRREDILLVRVSRQQRQVAAALLGGLLGVLGLLGSFRVTLGLLLGVSGASTCLAMKPLPSRSS